MYSVVAGIPSEKMKDQIVLISRLVRLLAESDPVSGSTLRRYINEGVTNRSGVVVKMKSAKLPSGLGSSVAYYYEFLKEVNK